MDSNLIISGIVLPLVVIIGSIIISIILVERDKRIKAEKELETTRESFKTCLEKVIRNNDINSARVTYVCYFGPKIDANADGMI